MLLLTIGYENKIPPKQFITSMTVSVDAAKHMIDKTVGDFFCCCCFVFSYLVIYIIDYRAHYSAFCAFSSEKSDIGIRLSDMRLDGTRWLFAQRYACLIFHRVLFGRTREMFRRSLNTTKRLLHNPATLRTVDYQKSMRKKYGQ